MERRRISLLNERYFCGKANIPNVYVVTSDGAGTKQILGSGGLRIPARELQNMISVAKLKRNDYNTLMNIGKRSI